MFRYDLTKLKPTLILIFGLIIIAAAARFYQLGNLGFYGDEETTAFPARAVTQERGATMPSGMPYHRALPHTWLNAMAARIFGIDREISYRVVSAIFGTLSIPLLFLLARPYFGTTVAFTAALLLAFSEWHILVSREARMYAPFLFFYIASGFSIWNWATSRKVSWLISSLLLFFVTTTLHTFSIFLIGFIGVVLLFRSWRKISNVQIASYIFATATLSLLYSRLFVEATYNSWKQDQGESLKSSAKLAQGKISFLDTLTGLPGFEFVLLSVGVLSAAWFVYSKYRYCDKDRLALDDYIALGLAFLSIILFCVGTLYAASILLLMYAFMLKENIVTHLRGSPKPTICILTITLIAVAYRLSKLGFADGLKQLFSFPYPYMSYFIDVSPVLLTAFCFSIFYLLFASRRDSMTPVKAGVLVTLLPIAAIGIVIKWGGIRYIIESYPFFLLIAAYGLVKLITIAVEKLRPDSAYKKPIILFTSSVFAVSGACIGHGIPQAINIATLGYGVPERTIAFGFPFYPDHKGAGLYVRSRLKPRDIVIAEDMLEQKWYASRVDYWIRDTDKSAAFLYTDTENTIRDIYVNSKGMTAETLQYIDSLKDTRIWFITSGESFYYRESNLTKLQLEWVAKIERLHTPVYTGKDKLTKVYCINCEP